MLVPSKHSHPDHTVLAAAGAALKLLRRARVATYDEVHNAVQASTSRADYLLVPAVDFLYLVGLIRYLPKADAFELTERQ